MNLAQPGGRGKVELPPGGFIRKKARINRMKQDNSKRIAPIKGGERVFT